MNDFIIKLLVNTDCQLISIDNSNYNLLSNYNEYESLDFLSNYDNELIENSIINNTLDNSSSKVCSINLYKDGVFNYFKVIIPTLNKLIINNEEDLYTDILLNNETFYYNNKVYIGTNNISCISAANKEDFINKNISEILSNSKEIDNYVELENIKGSQTFIYKSVFVSICKLQNCLIKLQRKILDDPRNCLDCNLQNNIRYNRDFLLSSIYVLQYLICTQNYSEIERIINNLKSCSNICEDYDSLNDCGCGTIKY